MDEIPNRHVVFKVCLLNRQVAGQEVNNRAMLSLRVAGHGGVFDEAD